MTDAELARFFDGLPAPDRPLARRLRALVEDSAPAGAVERLKWNAPSVAVPSGQEITLGALKGGGLRVVLHRGARPKVAAAFSFEDPDRLADWPAPDRAVLSFRSLPALEARAGALQSLFIRWFAAGAA